MVKLTNLRGSANGTRTQFALPLKNLLWDRLTVGQRTLNPFILVRIQVPQLIYQRTLEKKSLISTVISSVNLARGSTSLGLANEFQSPSFLWYAKCTLLEFIVSLNKIS